MPPRQSGTLTEAELRIMDVLWGKGSGTVQQVLDSITQRPALAYNSVLTTIRVLERKGYLKHLKDGRAHVYTPLVGQKEATRSEIRHLVSRFFKNSHEQLVLNLLEDQGIGPEEIGRLRQMLDPFGGYERSERREMNWLSVQTVAQISVERILNALPEGFLIALFAWALLRVLRRQNSGTRFAVWFLALLTVAALPVLGGIGEGRALMAGMSSGMGNLRPAITIPGRWALFVFLDLGAGRVRGDDAFGGWALAPATAAPELYSYRCGRSRSGGAKNGGGDRRVWVRRLEFNNDCHVRVRARACRHRFLEADNCPASLGVARTAGSRSERHPAARIRAPAALG